VEQGADLCTTWQQHSGGMPPQASSCSAVLAEQPPAGLLLILIVHLAMFHICLGQLSSCIASGSVEEGARQGLYKHPPAAATL
jgi:hypothetical protein